MTTTPAYPFEEFPKMARLSREVIVTEKIDGTNAQIVIWDRFHCPKGAENGNVGEPPAGVPWIVETHGGVFIAAGSRTRWITPQDDNYGFAAWVLENYRELLALGHGRHFGEWWGSGIGRGYGLPKGEKRLSLFNVVRFCRHGETPAPIPCGDPRIVKMQTELPECVGLAPILYRGLFDSYQIERTLDVLAMTGSRAAPGFMKPEGIVVFHTAGNVGFKKTIEKDDVPKSLANSSPNFCRSAG